MKTTGFVLETLGALLVLAVFAGIGYEWRDSKRHDDHAQAVVWLCVESNRPSLIEAAAKARANCVAKGAGERDCDIGLCSYLQAKRREAQGIENGVEKL